MVFDRHTPLWRSCGLGLRSAPAGGDRTVPTHDRHPHRWRSGLHHDRHPTGGDRRSSSRRDGALAARSGSSRTVAHAQPGGPWCRARRRHHRLRARPARPTASNRSRRRRSRAPSARPRRTVALAHRGSSARRCRRATTGEALVPFDDVAAPDSTTCQGDRAPGRRPSPSTSATPPRRRRSPRLWGRHRAAARRHHPTSSPPSSRAPPVRANHRLRRAVAVPSRTPHRACQRCSNCRYEGRQRHQTPHATALVGECRFEAQRLVAQTRLRQADRPTSAPRTAHRPSSVYWAVREYDFRSRARRRGRRARRPGHGAGVVGERGAAGGGWRRVVAHGAVRAKRAGKSGGAAPARAPA